MSIHNLNGWCGSGSVDPDGMKAVLWDMDGTLIDSEPLHRRSLLGVLASLDVTTGPELFEATVGRDERAVYRGCVERFSLVISEKDWIARRNAIYTQGAALLESRAGAMAALRFLRDLRVPQTVVSNASRELLDVNLAVLGLQDLRAVTVSRSEVQRGKPEPESYLRAANLLRVPARGALVVEDSPVGAVAGLAAGMRVLVWPSADVNADAFPSGCTHVSTAAELAEFLASNFKEAIR